MRLLPAELSYLATAREGRRNLRSLFKFVAFRVFLGDAADHEVLKAAGLGPVRSVLLSTHDDAANIYLAIYLRRLDPDVRIVSRITHERNLESIHRAGADLVLSFATLAVESITAALQNRELVLLGEGLEFFTLPIGATLAGKTLAESDVGARTGLIVIAIDDGDGTLESNPGGERRLAAGEQLLAVGSSEQRDVFVKMFHAGA